MKIKLCLLLIVLVFATTAFGADLVLRQKEEKPVIDGDLIDAAWSGSRSVEINNVKVSGYFDKGNIYFGISSQEKNIDKLMKNDKKDVLLAQGERIEISFSSNEWNKTYKILINSEGKSDSIIQDSKQQIKWDNSIDCKTRLDKEKAVWNTEIVIPINSFKEIIEANVPMSFYIVREGQDLKLSVKEWSNLRFVDKNEKQIKLAGLIASTPVFPVVVDTSKEKIAKAIKLITIMREQAGLMADDAEEKKVALEETDIMDRCLKSSDKKEFEKSMKEKYGEEGLTKKFLPSPVMGDPSKYKKSISEMRAEDFLEYKNLIIDMFDKLEMIPQPH